MNENIPKSIRMNMGLTQREFGKLLGISQGTVFRIENKHYLSVRLAKKLVKLTKGKYTLDDFFRYTEMM